MPKIDPYFFAGLIASAAIVVVFAVRSNREIGAERRGLTKWPTAAGAAADSAGLVHRRGVPTAPFTLREVVDFQCVACAAAETTIVHSAKALADAHVLQFIVYDVPTRRNSMGALVAATCASQTNPSRYWNYRELLFKFQKKWTSAYPPESELLVLADLGGLDTVSLRACIHEQGSDIMRKAGEAASVIGQSGINYTPTWSFQDSILTTEEVAIRLRRLAGSRLRP